MKQSSLILSLVLAALSGAAQASSFIDVVNCNAANAGPDHGITVSVRSVMGPPVQGKPSKSFLTASLGEQTIAGPRQLGSYTVKKSQGPGLGAPIFYSGKNFSLELMVDGTPVMGHIRGHVTAEAGGQRASEDLLCNFTR